MGINFICNQSVLSSKLDHDPVCWRWRSDSGHSLIHSRKNCWATRSWALFEIARDERIRYRPGLCGAPHLVGEIHVNQIIIYILSLNTHVSYFTSCHKCLRKEKYQGVIKAYNRGPWDPLSLVGWEKLLKMRTYPSLSPALWVGQLGNLGCPTAAVAGKISHSRNCPANSHFSH